MKLIIRICTVVMLVLDSNGIINGQSNFINGYIITNSSDTIFGLINLVGPVVNSNSCFFKINEKSDIIKYSPLDIKGYRFIDGKYYVSKTISYHSNSNETKVSRIEFDRKNSTYYYNQRLSDQDSSMKESSEQKDIVTKTVFLEYLIDGKVDFYVFFKAQNNPIYFVKTDRDTLIEMLNTKAVLKNQYNDEYFVEKKEYFGTLTNALHDCEGIQSKIAYTNLNNESLIKLAQYYHSKTCNDPNEECIVYEKKNRKTVISIIPVVNYSRLNVTYSDFARAYNYDFSNQKKLSYGVLISFSNFQYFNNHLSSNIGFLIQKQHFVSDDEYTIMDFTVLKIPVGLNLTFMQKMKFQPFLGLEVSPNIRLSKEVESNYNTRSDQIKNIIFMFSGKAGFNYYFSPKVFLTTSFKYEFGNAFYFTDPDISKIQSLVFQAGFGFVIERD